MISSSQKEDSEHDQLCRTGDQGSALTLDNDTLVSSH